MAQKDQYNVGSENADVYYHESLKLWRQKVFQLLILNENLNIQLKISDQKFSNLQKELQISMTREQENLFGIDKLNIKRSKIPAVTHIDYTARVQTVHQETNPRYYKLIEKFKKITGCPILVNTSFNIRGEPIVCSIKDAFRCFMGTNLDILVVENFVLFKSEQTKSLINDYEFDERLM